MAKARKRRPSARRGKPGMRTAIETRAEYAGSQRLVHSSDQSRPSILSAIAKAWTPGMVMLGCWGLAFSFLVFSTESNHLLYAGLAAFMALTWTIQFGIRVSKSLRKSLPTRA